MEPIYFELWAIEIQNPNSPLMSNGTCDGTVHGIIYWLPKCLSQLKSLANIGLGANMLSSSPP